MSHVLGFGTARIAKAFVKVPRALALHPLTLATGLASVAARLLHRGITIQLSAGVGRSQRHPKQRGNLHGVLS